MTGKKKGMSIGAAMKQRMDTQEGLENSSTAKSTTPTVEAGSAVQLPPVDPLEPFNTRLPRSLLRRLKVHAAQEGRKIQDVVQEALDEYIKRYET